ncbi:MAG: hypothetical protein ABFS45_06180 [Pseudomonadota bacterium]
MNYNKKLGLQTKSSNEAIDEEHLRLLINLKLAASGQPGSQSRDSDDFFSIAQDLLQSYREKSRLLADYYAQSDWRIQQFLDRYLKESGDVPQLPNNTLILDRHGVARELSLPAGQDHFISDIITSYRIRQGVLHNPASDRRTTAGSFHITEGGLPIPGDKKAVPKRTFSALLRAALNPPTELLKLPYTANQPNPATIFVSLLLRPVVCPEVPGYEPAKNMEIRFFAPGNLVSNLDFVESIFGNGGNPNLAENNAALDVEHWTGHSGCVILAPHLKGLTKKAVGLPNVAEASKRQRAEGMCWEEPEELYNDGQAFKVTARDQSGVIVTLLADNYYGYCKKEVKTQISYSANLYGLAEEEHSGGALAFQRRNHGEEFLVDSQTRTTDHTFSEMVELYSAVMDVKSAGYALDQRYPELIYVPEELHMDLPNQLISWHWNGRSQSLKLRPDKVYIQPNGYKIEMCKHPGSNAWRLVGTDPEGTFCHKPCTVSGGGKSEISKSIEDAVIYGPLFINDLEQDLDQVDQVFRRDYCDYLKPGSKGIIFRDTLLNPEYRLGSVIQLLTPSETYTDDYNDWLETVPYRIRTLAFIIKRNFKPWWGNNWRRHASVDIVNGEEGHELKLDGQKIMASYLRVGLHENNSWRIFKVRQDFIPTEKVQMEDDISASIVVPTRYLPNFAADASHPSVKLVDNCEFRLFQRPDEAIHPGFDKQSEADMSAAGNFIANFEPLQGDALAEIVEDVATFQDYTEPMSALLKATYLDRKGYVVSSAHPRMIDGKPSKNPRYLQLRPDLAKPMRRYLAEMGSRMHRRLPLDQSVCTPVDAVLCGRRNNPPEEGVRSLAVYSPLHYQELPELFMDFICSLTGKSPSTTGAGSEGALTKGPFNALRPTVDLNNALVSFILTGYAGYSSAAGHIGPNQRVDHDISLLIPEIWARLSPREQDPSYLIESGSLEQVEDFEYKGKWVSASRLGYRITRHFVHQFLGKVFDNPKAVFDNPMLRPETQDLASFVDGVDNIVEAQQRVAQQYFDDGCIEDACPPLEALLHIMAHGSYDGKDVHHQDIRKLFTRESLLASDWYQKRLETQQAREIALWEQHEQILSAFLAKESHAEEAQLLDIAGRMERTREKLNQLRSATYLEGLIGTIGADPLGLLSNQ